MRPRFQFRRCRRRPGGIRDSDRRRHRGICGADHRSGLSTALLGACVVVAAADIAGHAWAAAPDQGPADRGAIPSQGGGGPSRKSGRRVRAPGEKRRGGVIEATVLAVAGVAILIGLGVWQLDRKVWKESLIATLDTRLARAPEDLPPRESWTRLNPD